MAAVDQSVSLDEKTRRVRSLLSSYYGVDGAPSQGGSPKSEQSDTPSARSTRRMAGSRALAGLDSPAFDVERCLRFPTHRIRCIIDNFIAHLPRLSVANVCCSYAYVSVLSVLYLKQVSPELTANHKAGWPAGKAHRDAVRDQEPGLRHADARLRELQPLHLRHGHCAHHEVECGWHGHQHAGPGAGDRCVAPLPSHLRCLCCNSLLLRYSCMHVVQWGGNIETMTGSCGQGCCHVVMTLSMMQAHHWHVTCRECLQQDRIKRDS